MLHQDSEPVVVALLDDSPFEAGLLKSKLGPQFAVRSFQDEEPFFSFLSNSHSKPAVIFLDLNLNIRGSDGDGLLVLADIKRLYPKTPVIVYSSVHDPRLMLMALNAGAVDFIAKTADDREFVSRILAAANRRESLNEWVPDFVREIAVGRTMEQIATRVPSLVNSAVRNVHVCAPTGCGKEVVADLFEAFVGKDLPFIRINCAAISESLLESELFGHTKGAFTGAHSDHKGYFERANKGWLVLDEVGCLSKSAQAALLRAIENQEIIPVGSRQAKQLSVRVISLTNVPLEQLVTRNEFREDLWQRLTEVSLTIEALARRSSEIPDLIAYFCRKMTPGQIYWPTPPVIKILSAFSWGRGNVRELRNCLRAMTEKAVDGCLTPAMIPADIVERYSDAIDAPSAASNHKFADNRIMHSRDSFDAEDGSKKADQFRFAIPVIKFQEAYEVFLEQYINHFHRKFNFKSLREFARVTGMSRATLAKKIPSISMESKEDVSAPPQ